MARVRETDLTWADILPRYWRRRRRLLALGRGILYALAVLAFAAVVAVCLFGVGGPPG